MSICLAATALYAVCTLARPIEPEPQPFRYGWNVTDAHGLDNARRFHWSIPEAVAAIPTPRPKHKPPQRPADKRERSGGYALAYAGKSEPAKRSGNPWSKLVMVKRDGNEVTKCFPDRLRKILADVQRHFGASRIEIESGYRSPAYNAKLAKRSKGVAKKSLHMACKAADFYVPGVSSRRVYNYLNSHPLTGGLGFYGAGRWVHVDIGRKGRRW